MKTFTCIVVLLSLTTALFASPKCERLAFYDMANLEASYKRDLVSHAWRTSVLGMVSTLFFHQDGELLAISSTLKKVKMYAWSLSVDKGRAVLSITDDAEKKEFVVSPTCGGLSMNSKGKTASMLVTEENVGGEAQHTFLQKQLTGMWHYRSDKSKKNYPAQFTLALHKDGSFNLKMDPDRFHSTREGSWEVSADGRYLVLFTDVYVNGSLQRVPEAISLKAVDFEDMVIDAHTLPKAIGAYNSKQPLYLSKARA